MIPEGRWEGGFYVLNETVDARIWREAVAAERSRLVEAFRAHADEYPLGISDSTEAYVAYVRAIAWAIRQIEQPT